MKRQGGFHNLFDSLFSRIRGNKNEPDSVNEAEPDSNER